MFGVITKSISRGVSEKLPRFLSLRKLNYSNSPSPSLAIQTESSISEKKGGTHSRVLGLLDMPIHSVDIKNAFDFDLKHVSSQSMEHEESISRFQIAGLSKDSIEELMAFPDFKYRSIRAMGFYLYGMNRDIIQKIIHFPEDQLILAEEKLSTLYSLDVSSEAAGVSIILNSNVSKKTAYVKRLKALGVSGEDLDVMLLKGDLDGRTSVRVDELVGGNDFSREDRLLLARSLLHSDCLKFRLV